LSVMFFFLIQGRLVGAKVMQITDIISTPYWDNQGFGFFLVLKSTSHSLAHSFNLDKSLLISYFIIP
jgi:hypothetical protein